jgi:hypothetical protein
MNTIGYDNAPKTIQIISKTARCDSFDKNNNKFNKIVFIYDYYEKFNRFY